MKSLLGSAKDGKPLTDKLAAERVAIDDDKNFLLLQKKTSRCYLIFQEIPFISF
jgi:hypothetical protein